MTQVEMIVGAGGNELKEFILQSPNTLIYSEPHFLKLVSEHVGAHPAWLIARRKSKITGLLPFLFREGPLGPAYNSLAYYGSNGGVIQAAHDVEAKIALVEAYYDIAADANAVSATIISNPLEGDADFYDFHARYNFREERIGQVTHLSASPEELIALFDDPRPRNIRRAIKEGVRITRGGAEALDFLFNTHVDNMNAIGGTPKQREFFDAIPTMMHETDWAVFTASLNGKPIAALLLFYFNRTVEYFTPVIVASHRYTQALTLVIYEAMCDAIRRGFANWNWGGTWLNQEGVYDFKRRWGTSQYSYFYYTRVFNRNLKVCTPAYLLTHYPGFYLIPFNQLA